MPIASVPYRRFSLNLPVSARLHAFQLGVELRRAGNQSDGVDFVCSQISSAYSKLERWSAKLPLTSNLRAPASRALAEVQARYEKFRVRRDGHSQGGNVIAFPTKQRGGAIRAGGLGQVTRVAFTARRTKALLAASALAVLPASAYYRAPAVDNLLKTHFARTQAVAFYDVNGEFLGLHYQPLTPDKERDGRRELRMALSKPLPASFFRLLRWQENRHSDFDIFGIDVPATAWGAFCHGLGKPEWLNKVRVCTGGSGLISALAAAARGRNGNAASWKIKLLEIADSAALSRRHHLDDPLSQAMIVNSATYVSGTGGNFAGPEVASRILWGEPFGEQTTSLAKQALLVSFFPSPYVISCRQYSAPELKTAALEWNQRIRRAKAAIRGAYPEGGTKVVEALAELDRMPVILRPYMSDSRLAGLSEADRCDAAKNPIERLDRVASAHSIAARDELAALQKSGKLEAAPSSVELAMDLGQNSANVAIFKAKIAALQESQAGLLSIPLPGPASHVSDGLLVEIDSEGYIRTMYSGSGRLNLTMPRRSASLGKLIVATAASNRSPMEPLCNVRDPSGIRNSDSFAGYPKCDSRAKVSPTIAMQRSMTLPWVFLARSLPPSALDDAIKAFGGRVPEGQAAATAAPLGTVEGISPARWLANALALQRCVGGLPAIADVPTTIRRVKVEGTWKVLPRTDPPTDLRPFCRDEDARKFLAAVIGAALLPGGTIGVSGPSPVVGINELGKTGTDTQDDGLITAKYVLGSDAMGGYYGGIWAAKGPLGRNLDFKPLWSALRDAHWNRREIHR